MNIKSYGSGSDGNLYLISNATTHIILECGVSIETLRKMLNENHLQYNDINACITSHCHSDHSLLVKDIDNYDIKCYCTYETKNKYNLSDENFNQLCDNKMYRIGDIQILSFSVNHGQTECYGFILKDRTSMKLFITDFMSIEKNLSAFNVDEIFIECNYIDEAWQSVSRNNTNDILDRKYKRQINTHCELSNLVYMLKSGNFNLSNVDTINLIHISKELGNKEIMKKTIEQEFGIETYVLLPNGEAI